MSYQLWSNTMIDLMPDEILVSSVIVMPTCRYDELESELSHINNLPTFIDITHRIDPVNRSGQRKHPHLSFVHIKEPHNGYVYNENEDNEMECLGSLIVPFIEKGTTFMLQRLNFVYNGVDYYSERFNDEGMVSEHKELSEELADCHQPL